MEDVEFCSCENRTSVGSSIGEFGSWLVCTDCQKPVEDSFEYYNHYDGEDHQFDY